MSDSEKGLREVTDDAGNLVYVATEYNGHLYEPFNNFEEKIDGYRESFPVYDSDIYLLNYPKSGMKLIFKFLKMMFQHLLKHSFFTVRLPIPKLYCGLSNFGKNRLTFLSSPTRHSLSLLRRRLLGFDPV